MSDAHALLTLLADGKLHPVGAIAAQLGTDPATVSAQLQQLQALGLATRQHTAQQLGLSGPLELLDRDRIHDAMQAQSRQLLSGLDICLTTDSTNAQLRRSLGAGSRPGSACLSESQSAGRGRRGRQWLSPPASNIYLSASWYYPSATSSARHGFSGLSLAIAVAASQALADIGLHHSRIKWPNDLVWNDRKFGGILIESYPRGNDGLTVIVGIGINTALSDRHGNDIDQPWTDISRILGHTPPRNQLAARLLHHLLITLSGFSGSNGDWLQGYAERDNLSGRAVTITRPDGSRHHGIARGIDSSGALRLESDGVISHHPIGEASARCKPTGTGQ